MHVGLNAPGIVLAFVKKDLVYGFLVKPKMKHTHILFALLDTYKIFLNFSLLGMT